MFLYNYIHLVSSFSYWYKADKAGVTVTTNTQAIDTAAETIGAITLGCTWSAKKTNTETAFTLGTDNLSLVELSSGNSYVYQGTVDSSGTDHRKAVANRAGEQYIKVTIRLQGTVNSAQYGTYTVTVAAGEYDADVLYLQSSESAISWVEGSFAKSLEFTLTVSANAVDQSYSFWLVAKGIENVDQSSSKNGGSLTVTVA